MVQQKIVDLLKNNSSKISLTFDYWDSKNTVTKDGYLGITAHWVDADFMLRRIVLDFVHVPGSHTGLITRDALVDVLETFGIVGKIQSVTSDNGSNMVKAVDLLKDREYEQSDLYEGVYRVRCVCHCLHLVAVSGIDCQKVLVGKIRSLFVDLRYPLAIFKFGQLLKKHNITGRAVPLDVDVRWYSKLKMIRAAVHYKPAIEELCSTDKKFLKHQLVAADWKNLETLVEVFSDLEYSSEQLSSTTIPMLSDAIMMFDGLSHRLKELAVVSKGESFWEKTDRFHTTLNKKRKFIEFEGFEIIIFKSKFIELLETNGSFLLAGDRHTKWIADMCYVMIARLQDVRKEWKLEDLVVAMVLDPRLKATAFSDNAEKERVTKAIRDKFPVVIRVEPSFSLTPSENHARKPSLFNLGLNLRKGQASANLDEMDTYLQTSPEPEGTDILKWWKYHMHLYPKLSALARDYFSSMASSVESERCFSIAGNLITDRRNRMNAVTARARMCLNSWNRNLPELCEKEKIASVVTIADD